MPEVSCSPPGLPEAEPLERHENPHHDVLLLGLPSWPVLRKSIRHTAFEIDPYTVMALERGTRPKSKETHSGVRSCSVLNFHKRNNREMLGEALGGRDLSPKIVLGEIDFSWFASSHPSVHDN